MTQELLLKDLCARLPYRVKLDTLVGPQILDIRWLAINMCNISSPYLPYLFPISSMTEEQRIEFYDNYCWYDGADNFSMDSGSHSYALEKFDWLLKNHFDYRGLIPKGLAIDCTNLNIY